MGLNALDIPVEHSGAPEVRCPYVSSKRHVHPEAQSGEVCIGNVWACDFKSVGWKSKRIGKKALDTWGQPISGTQKPVFVNLDELLAGGVDIPDIGPIDHRW